MRCCFVLTCEQVQAALSAQLDGEPSPLDSDLIDVHVAGCVQCRAFYDRAADVNRLFAFSDVEIKVPDLSDEILAGVESTWRRQATTRTLNAFLSRIAMVIVGVGWVLWAIALLMTNATDASSAVAVDPYYMRVSMETVSLRCAIGFGLLFASWQPRVAGGLLPMMGALWMFSFGFAVRDFALGQLNQETLTYLLLVLFSLLVLLWNWSVSHGWVYVSSLIRSLGAAPHS
ncbi:hypothetical membrane protein [Corynebacterium kutscheri]|uniref:Hypothetical membrane protein n=1 Tax=Corynebacterium kutscheri TaxID=35755 RepID=A0AB38VPY9_9CORY|nr:hypothetical membrane protein [Corynebacterium kutscheri]